MLSKPCCKEASSKPQFPNRHPSPHLSVWRPKLRTTGIPSTSSTSPPRRKQPTRPHQQVRVPSPSHQPQTNPASQSNPSRSHLRKRNASDATTTLETKPQPARNKVLNTTIALLPIQIYDPITSLQPPPWPKSPTQENFSCPFFHSFTRRPQGHQQDGNTQQTRTGSHQQDQPLQTQDSDQPSKPNITKTHNRPTPHKIIRHPNSSNEGSPQLTRVLPKH